VHTAAANLNGNVVPEDIPKGAASDADFIRVFFFDSTTTSSH
jgi:sulfur carrier protein ThiS